MFTSLDGRRLRSFGVRLRRPAWSSSTRTVADQGSGYESGNRKRASPTVLSRCPNSGASHFGKTNPPSSAVVISVGSVRSNPSERRTHRRERRRTRCPATKAATEKRLARTKAAELETSVTGLVRGFLVELVSEESTGRSLERQERDLRAQIRNFPAGDRLSREDAHCRRN